MDNAYRQALRGTWIGIVVNLLLGIAKLVAGLAGNCFALVSDGLHSFSDLATSVGTLVGFRIAMKPPDANHPYGHSRAESLIAAYVSLALAAAGAWVGVKAIGSWSDLHDMPASFTLWVAGASMVVKECLFQYKIRLGRRLQSGSLIADAWDHRSDVLSSAAVLAGVALTRMAGWHWADDAAALFVGITLIWAAVVLVRGATHELMDTQADAALLAKLHAAAMATPGVRGVEKMWVRKAGLEYLVDIHIEVAPELTVRDSHGIAHDVQTSLRTALPTIHNVMVHIEPHAE